MTHSGFSEPDEMGAVRWELSIQRTIRVDISTDKAVHLAAGQSVEAAADRLVSSLPLADEPVVVISPAWWPRLPYLRMRILMTIE